MTTLTSQQRIGLVLLTLMWGLNWPIMKFSLRELPPLHFRALTMALGALMLALYFAWRGVRLRPRGWSEWRMVVLLGLPNVLGWHTLSIIGVSQLPAGRAATLGFTMPVDGAGRAAAWRALTARPAPAVVAVLSGTPCCCGTNGRSYWQPRALPGCKAPACAIGTI